MYNESEIDENEIGVHTVWFQVNFVEYAAVNEEAYFGEFLLTIKCPATYREIKIIDNFIEQPAIYHNLAGSQKTSIAVPEATVIPDRCFEIVKYTVVDQLTRTTPKYAEIQGMDLVIDTSDVGLVGRHLLTVAVVVRRDAWVTIEHPLQTLEVVMFMTGDEVEPKSVFTTMPHVLY